MTINNINNISDNINKMFETLFKTTDNVHQFFKDLKKVYNKSPEYRKSILSNIKKRINYKVINDVPDGINVEPKYDELDKNEIRHKRKISRN